MNHAIAPEARKRGRPSTAVGLGNPVDLHVGKRIKARRVIVGLTQEELARALYLSFQQVQKYERGANRVSAGRLYELSKALDVPIQYFFDGFIEEGQDPSVMEETPAFDAVSVEDMANLEAMTRAYSNIKSKSFKTAFFKLLSSVADQEQQEMAEQVLRTGT